MVTVMYVPVVVWNDMVEVSDKYMESNGCNSKCVKLGQSVEYENLWTLLLLGVTWCKCEKYMICWWNQVYHNMFWIMSKKECIACFSVAAKVKVTNESAGGAYFLFTQITLSVLITLFRDYKRPCHWKRFQQSCFIFCSFQSCFLFVSTCRTQTSSH